MRTISGLAILGIGVYLIQIPPSAPAAPVETVKLPAFVEPAIVQNTAKPANQEAVCVNGQCSLPQVAKEVTQSVLMQPVKQFTKSVKARPRLFSGRLFKRLRGCR